MPLKLASSKRVRIRMIALVAALVALSLAAYVLSPTGRVRMRLGSRTVAMLQTVRSVEACRIDPNWVQEPKRAVIGQHKEFGIDFHGFEIAGETHKLDAASGQSITVLLRDARTYSGGSKKDCDFAPNVAYRLQCDNGTLEALFDFQCNQMQMLTKDAAGRTTHIAWSDFDPVRGTLAALTKRALPNDPEIQKLPDR